MTFVITAIVASTALSVYGQQSAAKSEQESMNRRAEEEKMAAQGRALERQQELGKVLARNNMQLAQDGSSGEGTPASIALQSSKNSISELTKRVNKTKSTANKISNNLVKKLNALDKAAKDLGVKIPAAATGYQVVQKLLGLL